MQRYPDTGPSEQELRMRAAARVARRRSFKVSLVVVGSLILLNLFFYSQTHNRSWLLLDGVFALTLAYRAWVAFGGERRDDARIGREVERMRGPLRSSGTNGQPPVQSGSPYWPAPASAPMRAPALPPVPPPPPPARATPPGPSSGPARPDHDRGTQPVDPWSGAWNF